MVFDIKRNTELHFKFCIPYKGNEHLEGTSNL